MIAATHEVTLVVLQWVGVAPGILALACPDLGAAQRVARALRNAVRWIVVAGRVSSDEALSAMARGDVLLSGLNGSPPEPVPEVSVR